MLLHNEPFVLGLFKGRSGQYMYNPIVEDRTAVYSQISYQYLISLIAFNFKVAVYFIKQSSVISNLSIYLNCQPLQFLTNSLQRFFISRKVTAIYLYFNQTYWIPNRPVNCRFDFNHFVSIFTRQGSNRIYFTELLQG